MGINCNQHQIQSTSTLINLNFNQHQLNQPQFQSTSTSINLNFIQPQLHSTSTLINLNFNQPQLQSTLTSINLNFNQPQFQSTSTQHGCDIKATQSCYCTKITKLTRRTFPKDISYQGTTNTHT